MLKQDAHSLLVEKTEVAAGSVVVNESCHHETFILGLYQSSGTARIKIVVYTAPVDSAQYLELGTFYSNPNNMVLFKPALTFNKIKLAISWEGACSFYVVGRGSDTLDGSTSNGNINNIITDPSVSTVFVMAESVQGNYTLPPECALVALEGNRTYNLKEI